MNMILKTLKRINELKEEIIEEKDQLEYYEQYDMQTHVDFSKSKIAWRENVIRELELDIDKTELGESYLGLINNLSDVSKQLENISVTLSWCDDVPYETKSLYKDQLSKIEKLIAE